MPSLPAVEVRAWFCRPVAALRPNEPAKGIAEELIGHRNANATRGRRVAAEGQDESNIRGYARNRKVNKGARAARKSRPDELLSRPLACVSVAKCDGRAARTRSARRAEPPPADGNCPKVCGR